VAAVLTALVGYLLMHRLQTDSVQSLQHSMDTWRMALALIRWALLALVALCWNFLVEWLTHAGTIDHTKAAQLTALRWRAVTWLVSLELVLGQRVLVKALGLMAGIMQ
jgi:hypothetical protein